MDEKALKATTVINGFFDGVEVIFAIGDCQRTNGCIKVNNIRKIDEEHKGYVPSTSCLSDKRLNVFSVTKKDICDYFNVPQTIGKTDKQKTNQKKQPTIKKDFSRKR
ncbi:MAG: hypothetical protein WC719_03775 [Patescibacteria group bacterium]|jgi:hypothetical protein